ncbi:MAG: hypothetical protein K5657_04410 [Desulfovibrio sp.]|nr:hypothetical protein [Desulfovibrio sp.]
MSSLRLLLHTCLEKQCCPEEVLGFEANRPFPPSTRLVLSKENKYYEEAVRERFPKLMKFYITLRSASSADCLNALYEDMHGTKKDRSGTADAGEKALFFPVHDAGISLSWWLFGLGCPMRIPIETGEWSDAMTLRDCMSAVRYKHGWSEMEARWLVTQLHSTTKSTLVHRVITRVMTSLPRIRLFPEMPSVLDVYARLETAVTDFNFPDHCEPWMTETIILLKASKWRICVLLLVRQGSVSHWHVVKQQPRLKSERLALALTYLFDLYGEQDGLEYYLTMLNDEAIAQGFSSLTDVVRGASWKVSNRTKSEDSPK